METTTPMVRAMLLSLALKDAEDVAATVGVEANGTIAKWKAGGSSPQFMATCGWNKKTLKPADVITVIGYRFKDGSNAVQMQTQGGRYPSFSSAFVSWYCWLPTGAVIRCAVLARH